MTLKVQKNLFADEFVARFPSTRYMGSKNKIADWIWANIKHLDFHTCLDAFGGTGTIAYYLKHKNKEVVYNDVLNFNYHFGTALVENNVMKLSDADIDYILTSHPENEYPNIVETNFSDIYYTHDENIWIDRTITNIRNINDRYKKSIAFFALAQACIVKRPYNLFHRKNLYIRLADVKRSFGNKASWDKPFEEWFRIFAMEANDAVFGSDCSCRAICSDALEIEGAFDLVYVDTPYISKKGVPVDYADFYHFLEGLCFYDKWEGNIDSSSKHKRLKKDITQNPWTDKKQIYLAFDRLFEKYQDSIIVVSYRSDGIPSIEELQKMLEKYKKKVVVNCYGKYKYVLSTNKKSQEILLVGV